MPIHSFYRSPSQSQDEFHDPPTNLEMIDGSFNSNPFLTIVLVTSMLNQTNGQKVTDNH